MMPLPQTPISRPILGPRPSAISHRLRTRRPLPVGAERIIGATRTGRPGPDPPCSPRTEGTTDHERLDPPPIPGADHVRLLVRPRPPRRTPAGSPRRDDFAPGTRHARAETEAESRNAKRFESLDGRELSSYCEWYRMSLNMRLLRLTTGPSPSTPPTPAPCRSSARSPTPVPPETRLRPPGLDRRQRLARRKIRRDPGEFFGFRAGPPPIRTGHDRNSGPDARHGRGDSLS